MNKMIAPTPAKGVFIDNAWRPSHSGKTIPMIAPAEGVQFAAIAAGDATDIDLAVRAARRALDAAGVQFLEEPAQGVVLKRRRPVDEGLRPEALRQGRLTYDCMYYVIL